MLLFFRALERSSPQQIDQIITTINHYNIPNTLFMIFLFCHFDQPTDMLENGDVWNVTTNNQTDTSNIIFFFRCPILRGQFYFKSETFNHSLRMLRHLIVEMSLYIANLTFTGLYLFRYTLPLVNTT